MNHGIGTVLYPVRDLARAKELYARLLEVEPYMDEPYYAGFSVGDQDIGLVPNGFQSGMTGPLAFYHVDDIREALRSLLDAGARLDQDVRDVGGGKLTASVRDPDGNPIGLIQMPAPNP